MISFLFNDIQLVARLFFLIIGAVKQLSFYKVQMDLLIFILSLFLDSRVSL